jgi:hypothetical protein
MPHTSAPKIHSTSVEEKASTQKPETSVHPVEPQDPQAAGAAHAQQRSVLRHNVDGQQAQPHPETTAGQHATGSFTGSPDQQSRKKG